MSLNLSRSTNSGQKSKRTFNSNNSTENKKKSKQKTLGMAWGSNSLSSSRSSLRSSPFSDFGSYMEEKNRKLQNQFDAHATAGGSSSGTAIFDGVSIFVDGFTVPSSQELRGYMLKHGGRYENYFSRRRVTHIICSNLADIKVKNLRSFSGGLPVVKPTWILDSVVANKLLSWAPYELDQLASNQPKLSAFFAPKCTPVHGEVWTSSTCRESSGNEDPSMRVGTLSDMVLVDMGESTVDRSHISRQSSASVHEKTSAIDAEAANDSGESTVDRSHISRQSSASVHEKTSAIDAEAANDSGMVSESKNELNCEIREAEGHLKRESTPSPCEPSASVSNTCLDETIKYSTNFAVTGSNNVRHSTLGDPNFVENYFKNSRLHFIGTWRNRYRKRFPSSLSVFKSSNSKTGSSSTCGKTIIHIDMDCFFVSVIIRKQIDLQDKPVAVCHSDNPKGTAEISSANYPARKYGIKAGMFVRDAKVRCPHLVIVPYNFETYEEVADQFYDILHKHCCKVQAVSCDEAFLDVTDLGEDPELLTSNIRREIFETTGCSASAGVSVNMLMARLATRTAKPDGQCYIPPEKVDEYLHELPINSLPGVGSVLEDKLKRCNISTCGQLRFISKDSLQKDFGMKTGEMLWNYSRGLDSRLVGVIQESKSIGAEVNWGVRFKDLKDSQHFLLKLCKEVSLRLQGCGVQGRTFTLKIKKKRKDAGEPAKYMGCGDCDNLSHSTTVPMATDDVEVIQRIAKQLFGFFHIDVKQIRGVGLQVSKFESTDSSKQGLEGYSINSWLASASASASASTESGCSISNVVRERASAAISSHLDNDQSNVDPGPPPLCRLDIGVIESLPPELFSELNDIYDGKLVDYIAKQKGNTGDTKSVSNDTNKQVEVELDKDGYLNSDTAAIKSIPMEDKADIVPKVEDVDAVAVHGAQLFNSAATYMNCRTSDFMPSSLSQVDNSVLEQLPDELKLGIIELLSAHRNQEYSSETSSDHSRKTPQESLVIKTDDNQIGSTDFVLNDQLWMGNPPQWVDKFKLCKSFILNMLAETYKSGSTERLSSLLQHVLVNSLYPVDSCNDDSNEVFICLCELLKQYIKLKIESDIEEIYLSFRLLKRLRAKSKVFLEVYDNVFPTLQASVGEYYGGNLRLQ